MSDVADAGSANDSDRPPLTAAVDRPRTAKLRFADVAAGLDRAPVESTAVTW